MKLIIPHAVSFLAVVSLSAQGPPPPSVDPFRDSLAVVTDRGAAAALVTREHTGTVPDKSLRRLRYGWALIRLGELSDSAPPLIRAAQEFYEAAGRASRPAEAWFGVGAAKEVLDALGVREFRSLHQQAGTGWRQGAILAYLEALRLDPDDHEAAIEAAKLTLRDDKVVVRPGVGEELEQAVRVDSLNPLGWLLLGRFRRRLAQDVAAEYAYARAVTLSGPTVGIASLELSRELMSLGQADSGERVYYRGAAAADTETVKAYRKEIAILAPDSVLAEWDRILPSQRPTWLREFWHLREVASGRPEGTRLLEHERRWRLAYAQFRLIPTWTHVYSWGMPYRSGNDDLDDRGIIFIRHGDPDQRIVHSASEEPDRAETWVYERPEGKLIFHFVLPSPMSGATSGWRVVESAAAINNSNVIPDLIGVDPIYMSLYQAGQRRDPSDRVSVLAERERQLVLASIHRGTTTDSDPLRFERRLHPIVQVYGVGGDLAGQGRLLLIWALPGSDRPPADTVAGVPGVIYSVRSRLNVTDSTGRLVLAVDTVRWFHYSAPLPHDNLLVGMSILDVAAGSYNVQVTLADSAESQGALRVVESIPVPAFAGPVEMGDLVLGLNGQGLFWDVDGARFPLNPRNAWTENESMEIGFELAGLPAGTPYKVRIGIADLGADTTAPAKASVEFEKQASGVRELVAQSLGLRSLKPGRYLLTAVVTTPSEVLKRERRITIAAAQ